MFNFTTTNVINYANDPLTGKPIVNADSENGIVAIRKVGNFKKENVTAIYKATANDPELAIVAMGFSGVDAVKGDVFRLNIYVGLTQASQNSLYSNDLVFKGKPFSVDFVYDGEWGSTLAALEKTINKYELMVYGSKLLKVKAESEILVLEATDEYQRFIKVNIEKFDKAAYAGMGEYTVVKSLDDVAIVEEREDFKSTEEGRFVGKEGFGTYSYVLHNLRIPTFERTRAFGVNQEESPIVGAKYDQYTIHYTVDRGVLGTNAVGDTVTSKTTHVFYVLDSLSENFGEAIAKLGTIIEVPETVGGASADSENEETI